jgi:hypothetical protein
MWAIPLFINPVMRIGYPDHPRPDVADLLLPAATPTQPTQAVRGSPCRRETRS